MNTNDLTTTFAVEQTPEEVFAAVNDVRGWWSEEIDGDTALLGDEFVFAYEDVHRSKQTIVASVPGEKVVWQVVEGYLSFTSDPAEWTGTEVHFEISRTDGLTTLQFTHVGLSEAVECYDSCSNAWDFYINDSLRDLIVTGHGRPNQRRSAVASG